MAGCQACRFDRIVVLYLAPIGQKTELLQKYGYQIRRGLERGSVGIRAEQGSGVTGQSFIQSLTEVPEHRPCRCFGLEADPAPDRNTGIVNRLRIAGLQGMPPGQIPTLGNESISAA